MIKTTFYGLSDMGMVRTNNEDTFMVSKVCDDRHVLAIVVDGVGGYEGGEVAAAMARDSVSEFYKKPEGLQTCLRDAVVAANNSICQARKEVAMYGRMSCVLTSVLVDLQALRIEMAHVGDTRLYQFYDGRLQKLSHDHSLVGYREEIGELTEQEAMNHPNRNLISKVVGIDHLTSESDYVEYSEFPLIPGSALLLCSDGLYDMITSDLISNVLNEDSTVEEKVGKLIRCANEAGGRDNVTVVLIQTEADNASPVVIEQNVEQPQAIECDENAACLDKAARAAVIRTAIVTSLAVCSIFFIICTLLSYYIPGKHIFMRLMMLLLKLA